MTTPDAGGLAGWRPNRRARLTSNQILELIEAGRVYYPPTTGLHICGSDDARNAAITVASFPMEESKARSMFERLRQEFGDMDADDVVVDLFVNDDRVDDFSMRRQLVERFAKEIANGQLPAPPTTPARAGEE